jgi:hypothetical protein
VSTITHASGAGGSGAVAAADPRVFTARAYLPGGVTIGGGTGDRTAVQSAVDAAVALIAATSEPAVVDLGGETWYLNTASSTSPNGFPARPVGVRLPVNLPARLTIRNGVLKLSTANANTAFWINQGGGYSTTAATTSGSTSVTATASIGTFAVGQVIRGAGITDTTTITAVSGTTLTLSQAATATATGVTVTSWAYDVFCNVTFEDVDVDNNGATGRCHLLVGNRPAADTPTRYLSFADITFRRCRGWGVPDDATQATTRKDFVDFIGVHNTPAEATQTYTRNILVEDCTVLDAQGGLIVASLNGIPSNHYHDNIRFHRCSHTRTTVPTVTLSQTSFFIGGGGVGGFGEVVDCYSENSADDGIEVGAMQNVLIDRFRCVNAFLEAIFFRHSKAPTSIAGQILTVRDTHTEIDSRMVAATGVRGRSIAFGADQSTYEFGEVRIERLIHRHDGMTYSKQGITDMGISVTGPIRRAELHSCAVHLTNYTYDDAGIKDHHLFLINLFPAVYGTAIIRDCATYVSTITNTAAGNGNYFGITPQAGHRIYIDGFDSQIAGAPGVHFAVNAGYIAATIRQLGIRRVTGNAGTPTVGQTTHGIRIAETGTIQAGVIADCDLRQLYHTTTAADVERTAAGANSIAIVERGMTYGAPPAATTPTVGASPYAYRNTSGVRQTVTVSGGTVTQIELGDTAAAYTATGLTNGAFTVDHGRYLRITYSVAPTVKTVPLI